MAIALVIALSGSTESGAAPSSSLPLTAAPEYTGGHNESQDLTRRVGTQGSALFPASKRDVGTGFERRSPQARTESPSQPRCRSAHKALAFYRSRYLGWRDKMGAGRFRQPNRHQGACPRYLSKIMRAKAHAARKAYERWASERRNRYRRLYEKWRCIHEHEGAWNASNPPYHGGLQFDDDFQRAYGPEFFRRWGGAENWPVYAQLIAAERAYQTRGFGPWPNTRRMCGV